MDRAAVACIGRAAEPVVGQYAAPWFSPSLRLACTCRLPADRCRPWRACGPERWRTRPEQIRCLATPMPRSERVCATVTPCKPTRTAATHRSVLMETSAAAPSQAAIRGRSANVAFRC
jgi:hypothetical protein